MNGNLIIKNASELVTCSGFRAKKGQAMSDLAIIPDGAVVVKEGIIKAVGTTRNVLFELEKTESDLSDFDIIDARGKAVLPGFVDSHTHLVFGGYRAEEFSWRLRGDSYMEIMRRGGGIVNTVNATWYHWANISRFARCWVSSTAGSTSRCRTLIPVRMSSR